MTTKQDLVLVNLLFLKKQFEEAARAVDDIIKNPATKKLSDKKCEKLLKLFNGIKK